MGNSTSAPSTGKDAGEEEEAPRTNYRRRLSPGVDFQSMSFVTAFEDEPPATKAAAEDSKNKIQDSVDMMGQVFKKGIISTVTQIDKVGKAMVTTATTVTTKTLGAAVRTPRHLQNVFVKPLDMATGALYKPPVYEKSKVTNAFLRNALQDHFVFANLPDDVTQKLVAAFELHEVSKGTDLITQGELATGNKDYFYVLFSGSVDFIVNGKVVGKAENAGDSFGELALLYSCPRAATVRCTTDVAVFRIQQKAFRYIMQTQREHAVQTKLALLSKVPMFANLKQRELLKLQELMMPFSFEAGQVLARKGEAIVGQLAIIHVGEVKITDMEVGGSTHADTVLGPGDYGGEAGLLGDATHRMGNATALSDGLLFTLDPKALQAVLGPNFKDVLNRRGATASAARKLGLVPILHSNPDIDTVALEDLVDFLKEQKFHAGQAIVNEGIRVEAALFFIKEGAVEISSTKKPDLFAKIEKGGFFGEELLRADAEVMKRRMRTRKHKPAYLDVIPVKSVDYTVTCVDDCTVQILYLKDMRNVVDTTGIGEKHAKKEAFADDAHKIPLNDLKRHKILGAGTFGQVWLVSYDAKDPDHSGRQAYALKVQSKYQLCENGQARAVVQEKNIMAALHHPFLASLVDSYQDKKCVYMLMGLVQGGELASIIHDGKTHRHGLPEADALFFAAAIHEGLAFMHRRGYVYRDLKPENVLISDRGYPVIVDYGFMKYIEGKTYTFCGTPLYLAPEIILNEGHDWGADHWSFGVLVFELLYGYTPFYEEGMDQMALFKAIIGRQVEYPPGFSSNCEKFLKCLLRRRPYRRLGAQGEEEIAQHAWFQTMDFQKLFKQEYKSPYVPQIKDPLDVANFADWRHLKDKSKEHYPPLTTEQEAYFENF